MKPIEVIIKYLIWHFGSAETLTRYIIELDATLENAIRQKVEEIPTK